MEIDAFRLQGGWRQQARGREGWDAKTRTHTSERGGEILKLNEIPPLRLQDQYWVEVWGRQISWVGGWWENLVRVTLK